MATEDKRPYEKPTLEPSSIFGADTTTCCRAEPNGSVAQRTSMGKGKRTSTTSQAARDRGAAGPEARLLLLSARATREPAATGARRASRGPLDWPPSSTSRAREGIGIAPALPPPLTASILPLAARGARWSWSREALGDECGAGGSLGRGDRGAPTGGRRDLDLKGMALAHTVYAEPGLRPMADIDSLVRPADRAGARDPARACYRTPGRSGRPHAASRSFAELVRDGTRIDLHWHAARYLRLRGRRG